MGAFGGLLGVNGGASGTGFATPAQASLVNPVTADQISQAQAGSQNSLAAQQALLQALQAQQGLQNQSTVYGQLQDVAAGRGPNPAQAMLSQATGANVANQAALMAGQRGASSNAGLIARQAAMQGSGIQQQAANQAAVMQANQSLNALNASGQIANTQAANQIGQTNANTAAQQAQQQALLGAQAAYNQAQLGSQQSVNAANAGLAQTGMQGQREVIGGIGNAIGAGMGLIGGNATPAAAAQGGIVMAADGLDASAFQGPQSRFGQFLATMNQPPPMPAPELAQVLPAGENHMQKGAKISQGLIDAMKARPQPSSPAFASAAPEISSSRPMMTAAVMSRGGQVPAMVSPGEKYLSPSAVEQVKQGANPMAVGETIPGKPKVGGAKNSYSNDTVPKTLEEGGIVVPRSATKAKDAERASAEFVHKVLAKRGAK